MVGIVNMQSSALMNPAAAEELKIRRMRELARALQERAMEEAPTQVVGGYAVPQSGWQALAKGIQGLTGSVTDAFATSRESDLAKSLKASRDAALQSGDPAQMLATGDPLLTAYATRKMELAQKQQEQAAKYGKNLNFALDPQSGKVRGYMVSEDGTIKDTGLEQPPQSLLSVDTGSAINLIPRGQTEPTATFRKDYSPSQRYDIEHPQLDIRDTGEGLRTVNPRDGRISAPLTDSAGGPIRSPSQVAMDEREKERKRNLAERMYKIEMSQWEKENPTYHDDEKKLKQAELNKKYLDDAADTLSGALKQTQGDNRPNFSVGPWNADRARSLANSYQALMWQIRNPEMANTGVLNPGEVPMLEQAIADPTKIQNVDQVDAILTQIEQLKATAGRNIGSAREVFGKRAKPPTFNPDAEVDLPESYLSDMEKSLGMGAAPAQASAPTSKPSIDDLLKKYGRK